MKLDLKLVVVWLTLCGAVFIVAAGVLFATGAGLGLSLTGGLITADFFAAIAWLRL